MKFYKSYITLKNYFLNKNSSFIYKEDNVYGDRAIKDYKNPGLESILESERIKKEILDFEQDMWNR